MRGLLSGDTLSDNRGHLPREAAVIKTILTLKLDHESLFEIVGCLAHDLGIAVLKYVVTPNFDLAIAWLRTHRRLRTEVDQLAAEIALVLRHVCIERRRQPRVVPCCRLGVVINKVHTSCCSEPHLPSRR